jgi:hypothetical protein
MTFLRKIGRRFMEVDPVAIGFVSALVLWGFGYEKMWARYKLEIDGDVIASRSFVPHPEKGNDGTEYFVRELDGRVTRHVTTGPMPVGTHVRKEWGHFDFEIDGRRVGGFPIVTYSIITNIALLGVFWGIFGWWLRRG